MNAGKKEEGINTTQPLSGGDAVRVCVGGGKKNIKTVKEKCERLHRNEKKESQALWIGRPERSPVVCARWCSLIIHCMRWMSLSPHTARLYSALCLGAPGSADEPVRVRACACVCVHRLGGGYDIGP